MSSSVVSETTALKSVIPIVPSPPSAEPTKDLNVSPNPAETKEEQKTYYVKFSFMITYILLLTTATLTFIEANAAGLILDTADRGVSLRYTTPPCVLPLVSGQSAWLESEYSDT